MKILGYELINPEKVDRAINGSITREGKATGGVGDDATDELILAAYDRLGGLILKDGDKVQTGCFCDLEESKKIGSAVVIEEPFLIFEHRDSQGNLHLVDEDEDEPEAIKMAKLEKKNKSKDHRIEVEVEAKEYGVKFTKSDKTSAIKNKIRNAKRDAKKAQAREKRLAEKKAKEEAKKAKEIKDKE